MFISYTARVGSIGGVHGGAQLLPGHYNELCKRSNHGYLRIIGIGHFIFPC